MTFKQRARVAADHIELTEGRPFTKPDTVITILTNQFRAVAKVERDKLMDCVQRDPQLRPYAPKVLEYLKQC